MGKRGIKAALESSVDLSKIQKLLQDSDVDILVGMPSGRKHIKTTHSKTKKHKTASQSDDLEVCELARILHFGGAGIPARPFLTDAIEANKEELRRIVSKEVQNLKSGKGANWDKVGTAAVGKIQEYVRSDVYKEKAPNNKKTIKAKGSDTPLIDSADLINSLTYLVVDKKKKSGSKK